MIHDLYKLVPIRHDDIFLIMQWRNEQIEVLRQNKILTPEDQEKYYQEVIKPSFTQEKPDLILFSFLYDNECIGYGGLTHIQWAEKRAEVSFLLATERAKNIELYKKEFAIFLSLLKEESLHLLDELFTETYDIRPDHVGVLEEQGFLFEKKIGNSLFHIYRRNHV